MKTRTISIDGHTLHLTNLDKILWPADGYTKADLIAYYTEFAEIIMPFVQGRPMTLHRYPNGIASEDFYQKHVDDPPEWFKTESIYSESTGEIISYAVCDDIASLIYLANLACIELHVWNSRVGSLDNPDYLVIDLDPLDIPFAAVIEAALTIHEVTDSFEIPSYVKTSGATGLHIYVPMGAKYTYEQTRLLARIIAAIVHARLPKTTSLARQPAKRPGLVYLDTGQNAAGMTMAAPYSIRPLPTAPVSTPVDWSEVSGLSDSGQWRIDNIKDRPDRDRQLFLPVLSKGIDLPAVLDRLVKLGYDRFI